LEKSSTNRAAQIEGSIVEVVDWRGVINGAIRDRAERSSRGSCTKHFVLYEQGNEVAFLSVDPRPDLNLLVIYEVFVVPELRRHGISTRVLLAAEKLARETGFPRARLTPKALGYPPGEERDRETRKLIEWYERHGYRVTADSGFVEWQKEL
jgi:GNAT superfamily N-acetyltransferase